MASTDLQVTEERLPHLGTPAWERFAPEMRALIKRTIMPVDSTDSELYYVLELAATYGLDPFARELWAARMRNKDGADKGPVSVLVGRDGFLAIAERHQSYRGFRNHAVHEQDEFAYLSEPRQMPDGTWSHVVHSWGMPNKRGKLIGGWAEVYREGRPPTYFYAPLEEYERQGDFTPWKKQKSVMIEKCALSTALRLAFRITGLYMGDEVTRRPIEMESAGERPFEPDARLVSDPWWADRLETLFGEANRVKPGAYMPGKQRLLTTGKDDEALETLAADLSLFIVEHGGTVPEPPEQVVEGEVLDPAVEDAPDWPADPKPDDPEPDDDDDDGDEPEDSQQTLT